MAEIGRREIKLFRQVIDGGYVAHTLGVNKISRIDTTAYAQLYHQPYQADMGYAMARAIGRGRRTKNASTANAF